MLKRTLGLLVVGVALAGPTPAADALTADEIVARNAAARGGLEAWRAARSIRLSGRMDVGQGMQVPFTLQLKRHRKMRLEFLFDGQMVVQAYDGKAGWKRRPYLGRAAYELMSPEELQGAAGQAELDGPLIDSQAKGHAVELEGTETVEGRPAYRLAVTLTTGVVRRVYVDAETFLDVKVDGARRLRGKEYRIETFFRHYEAVDGLLVARTVETRVEGSPGPNAMRIERVEVNPALDDTLFAPPHS